MGVGQFDTKIAVVVRDDLASWQRLNVTAFMISGVAADAGTGAIGEDYVDADGRRYLPLLVQPVLVLEAGAAKLRTVRERAERRGVPIAIYTNDMFAPATTRTTAPPSARSRPRSSTSSGSPCGRHTATPTRCFAA